MSDLDDVIGRLAGTDDGKALAEYTGVRGQQDGTRASVCRHAATHPHDRKGEAPCLGATLSA